MDAFSNFLLAAAVTFVGCSIAVPVILTIGRIIGLYAIVQERRSQVYMLFGKVVGILDEPGLHFLPAKLGPAAFLVNWLGKCNIVDLRLDQIYLRSQAVNSEEGAPMGIGIWYEMFVSDPVSFLFKNTDPRGSLSANVSNSTVRCLSNLPLAKMLVNRHIMSDTVRNEVTPKSHEWGYKLGSVYIRKVHFRDAMMIKQIESKVVNRLRVNQVSVITSIAEKTAAVELAKAAAVRPEIVGNALRDISADPDVAQAVFDVLEAQKIINGKATVTLMPASSSGGILTDLLAAQPQKRDGGTPAVKA